MATSVPSQPKRGSGTQAIERAMALVRRVAESGPGGERLTALARSQGISASTAHRMLAALVGNGLLRRDEDSQRYRLGHFVLTLGILSEPKFHQI